MKRNVVKKISNIEKALLRPNRVIGDVNTSEHVKFIERDNKIIEETIQYNPGLNKIIRELIDNGVDEHLRTNGKYATKIDVTFDLKTGRISVKDNGRGIPILPVDGEENMLMPEAAWCELNAGSNFEEEEDNMTLGQNGEGASLTNVFSKEFIGETTNE